MLAFLGEVECLVKVKKKTPQKPCAINLAQRRIQKDRDQSWIDQIENVTVKRTLAGTDSIKQR